MIDMHCHSDISDCSMTVHEVIDEALFMKIKHLAVTDHDTTKGIDEALYYSLDKDIEIIPGIEISAYDYKNNKKAHILGYYIDSGKDILDEYCSGIIRSRNESSLEQIDILKKNGYDITAEEVLKIKGNSTAIYKQHIMQALINKGYTDGIYSNLYTKLFKNNGIAQRDIKYLDAVQSVKMILESGGLPVLAHPYLYGNTEIINRLKKEGLAGIEVYHPSHSAYQAETLTQIAEEYDLVITGGSDFHGKYGNGNEIPGNFSPGLINLNNLKLLIYK